MNDPATPIVGDIWKLRLARDWVVVPTNQGWKSDGTNVMGRGIAAQAARKYRDLPVWYGGICRQYREHTPTLAHPGHRLILFPTKVLANRPHESWKGPATLARVRTSLHELSQLLPNLPWSGRILMPAVGCGNGGLDAHEVVPELLDWAQRWDTSRNPVRVVLAESDAGVFAADGETDGYENDDLRMEESFILPDLGDR